MFSIENSSVETRRFTRNSSERGQSFRLKYRLRKGEGSDFTISNELFTELGFEDHSGAIVPLRDDDGQVTAVGIIVLPEGHEAEKFMLPSRGEKKGKKFNNGILEERLAEVGLIQTSEEWKGKNQLLDVALYEETKVDIKDGKLTPAARGGYPMYIVVEGEGEVTESSDEEEAVEAVEA